MVGCLFLGITLLVFGVAILLIPLGTALSFGQSFVVSALLGAAAWTARAAWRDSGPLALVLDVDGQDHCFPALPEDEAGVVALEFVTTDGVPRVHRASRGRAPAISISPLGAADEDPPRLELRRTVPGARRGTLSLTRGSTTLWTVAGVRVGRRVPLSDVAARVLGLPPGVAAGLMFLDR